MATAVHLVQTRHNTHHVSSVVWVTDGLGGTNRGFGVSFGIGNNTTVCSKKSDAKIEITITATNLIRIKYPLSSCNYHLSGANIANFNKIHCTVFEQQLFKKSNSKTEVSNMEKSP